MTAFVCLAGDVNEPIEVERDQNECVGVSEHNSTYPSCDDNDYNDDVDFDDYYNDDDDDAADNSNNDDADDDFDYNDDNEDYNDDDDNMDYDDTQGDDNIIINDHDGEDDGNELEDGNGCNNFALIRWILIIFFRLQHRFNISNIAATAILAFFSMLLNLFVHPLSSIFPKTLANAIQITGACQKVKKTLYIVCPKENCNSIHGSSKQRCDKMFYEKVCGTSLGYNRNLSFGKRKWKPFKKFQFVPPSTWLRKMFLSAEFNALLEQACSANSDTSILEDISNGRLWKEMVANGFTVNKHNLCLMLNVDWFKPFKRSEYKVAAIMLTILNLPRGERFKKKWTMIAGITKSTWK